MPKKNDAEANEAAEAEVETYSREEVEDILAKRDRHWQSRLTPLQQERAELRRSLDRVASLEGRFNQFAEMMESRGGAPAQRNGHEEPDWDNVDSGQKLAHNTVLTARNEFERMWNERMGATKSRREAPSATEERMEAMLLERDLEKLRDKYPGLTDHEERQILELSERTGNGDMGYCAFRLFGSTSDWKAARKADASDDDADVPDESTSRRLTKQAMLRGRARAQAQTAGQGQKVKLPRGQAGYGAATKVAKEWLEGRGHS